MPIEFCADCGHPVASTLKSEIPDPVTGKYKVWHASCYYANRTMKAEQPPAAQPESAGELEWLVSQEFHRAGGNRPNKLAWLDTREQAEDLAKRAEEAWQQLRAELARERERANKLEAECESRRRTQIELNMRAEAAEQRADRALQQVAEHMHEAELLREKVAEWQKRAEAAEHTAARTTGEG
jgi:hypothetical protein